MVGPSILFSILWRSRIDDVRSATLKVEKCLALLSEIDDVFAGWRQAGKDEVFTVPISREVIEQWVKEGQARTDVGNKIIPGGGFTIMLGAALPSGKGMSLHVRCGCSYSNAYNTVVLKIPTKLLIAKRLVRLRTATSILKSLIAVWSPEHGMFTTSELRDRIDAEKFEFNSGWLTFLSSSYATFVDVPVKMIVEQLKVGRLLSATDDEVDFRNTSQHNVIEQLSRALAKFDVFDEPS